MQNQNLLTPEQAAVYLGVRQVDLNCLPSLPVVMIGRDRRYLVRDLERWVLSRRIVPITETT